MWPAMTVRRWIAMLPEPHFAAPVVHLGTLYEVDIGTCRDTEELETSHGKENGTGCVALATYAPPRPALTLEPQLPGHDVYEVRGHDGQPPFSRQRSGHAAKARGV